MKISKCCKSTIVNIGYFRDKWQCAKCEKINPETIETSDWEMIAENTFRLKVEGGYLYDKIGSRTDSGDRDVTHNIVFVRE